MVFCLCPYPQPSCTASPSSRPTHIIDLCRLLLNLAGILNDFACCCSIEWKLKYTYVYISLPCCTLDSRHICGWDGFMLMSFVPACVHVRGRVHAYKSLAFAFSPCQAIRIFYFNLITPKPRLFSVSATVSTSTPAPFSPMSVCPASFSPAAFVTLHVFLSFVLVFCY